jgi:hypothetical protein
MRSRDLTRLFGDFWSWAYSDTLSNSNRSVFAEYLVGYALDMLDRPRTEWDRCDLYYQDKVIEFKASAYLQSWPQTRLSTIAFDIGPHEGWNAIANSSCAEPRRCADCYIFCVFADRERSNCLVADVGRWNFYIAATSDLDRHFGPQKSARLSSIERVASPIGFEGFRAEVDKPIGSPCKRSGDLPCRQAILKRT